METNPARDLEDVRRLRADTLSEARRMPRGAFAVMGAATVVWFTGFGLLGPEELNPAAAAWIAMWWVFFVGWRLWTLRSARARLPTDPADGPETKTRVLEWTAFFAVGQIIVWLGSQVSWVLVGVLLVMLMFSQTFLNWMRWKQWGRARR